MYLVITREEDIGGGCSCCAETVDVFCTLLHKAGKFDPNALRKKWMEFKSQDTILKYFMNQPNITANFTKAGKVRVNVFNKEFKKRNISFTNYLLTYAGFKKVKHRLATDMSWY